MEEAALHSLNPALVEAVAAAWVGTPHAPRQAVRGTGCDCIGLVRGVWRDLTGADVPVPGWTADWLADPSEPLAAALRGHADPVPVTAARPGHVVTWRVAGRVAHVGILAQGGRVYHAPTRGRVRCDAIRAPITSAWALRAHPEAVTGPADLTPDDCLAVIYPADAGGVVAQITVTETAELVAVTPIFPDVRAALRALTPVFPDIETME